MKQVAVVCALASPALVASQYTVASSAPRNDVFDGYVSYSIEFASFPDFAGNKTHPNTFSDTLLENIKNIIGTKPYIRVGGNTQDYALYDASLPYALQGIFDPARSEDYPTTITIGPSYFESYNTWKDVKFSHGFNLGLGANRSSGWQTLLDTVPLACKALGGGKLYVWGYGNEPDLYSISAQGPVRQPNWNEETYVSQWLNGTRTIESLIEEHCPELATDEAYGYLAPSFAGSTNPLNTPATWAAGLNEDQDIKLFSLHNYISGAATPGVTLQGTLLNHAVTKHSVDTRVADYNTIVSESSEPVPPLIFGETNSLYNQGRPGLSNTFGAALWGVDFNLYSASVGFKRVHMHMGTNYRYASWQPLYTPLTTIGTKAPYYGNIAVASALGNLALSRATVVEIPLSSSHPHSAYAIYTSPSPSPSSSSSSSSSVKDPTLARLVLLNLQSHNTTLSGAGLTPLPSPPPRPSTEYVFTLSHLNPGHVVGVRRLLANGSDAITGITWDGWSYNWELDGGRPVRLGNVTVGEQVAVGEGGEVRVSVPDASGVVLDLDLDGGRGLDLGVGVNVDVEDVDVEVGGVKRGRGRRWIWW